MSVCLQIKQNISSTNISNFRWYVRLYVLKLNFAYIRMETVEGF